MKNYSLFLKIGAMKNVILKMSQKKMISDGHGSENIHFPES